MVNSILNAVTKQLGTTFGDTFKYYVEDVEQGLKKPCFTVGSLMPMQRSKSPVLYDRTVPLVVHYFTDSNSNIKQNNYDVAERVVECLEHLPVGNALLRGRDISWQITDDVLQVFVTYKFETIRLVQGEENMETLHTSIGQSQ